MFKINATIMTKPVVTLFACFVTIGCAGYFYAVGQAVHISWYCEKGQCIVPPFLSTLITTVSTVLSTNLGAVLGISIAKPDSKLRLSKSWNPLSFFDNPSPSVVQTAACYVYIIALVSFAIAYAHKDFADEGVVPIIQEQSRTLLGIIAGVFGVILTSQAEKTKEVIDDAA